MNATARVYTTCPICESARITGWRKKDGHQIDRCESCAFAFVNPRPTADFLMNYYSSRGHKLSAGCSSVTYESLLAREKVDPSSTADATKMIETIGRHGPFGSGARFLDVGCGYGFFSLEAQRAGYKIDCIELAEEERRIANQALGIAPASVSFEDFDGVPDTYSVILLSQILEHALDIKLWTSKAHSLLAQGGLLAIALPNFSSAFRLLLQEHDPFVTPPEHLNYFSIGNLTKLLELQRFKVVEIQCYSHIHAQAIERRLPASLKLLSPVIKAATSTGLKILDALRIGMMIRVYATKV